MARRQEVIDMLVLKLQKATGKSKSECNHFAIRAIETWNATAEREAYYQRWYDSVVNDFDYFLRKFKEE